MVAPHRPGKPERHSIAICRSAPFPVLCDCSAIPNGAVFCRLLAPPEQARSILRVNSYHSGGAVLAGSLHRPGKPVQHVESAHTTPWSSTVCRLSAPPGQARSIQWTDRRLALRTARASPFDALRQLRHSAPLGQARSIQGIDSTGAPLALRAPVTTARFHRVRRENRSSFWVHGCRKWRRPGPEDRLRR
jgi:hypothetical protein